MKFSTIMSAFTILAAGLGGTTMAYAGSSFDLTITNTSSMPISGGVVYISTGQGGTSEVGQMASPGFIALCQTGNASIKFNELKSNSKIKFAAQTPGPILPGKAITVEVPLPNAKVDSLHFEAMYGKSKEACASISLSAQAFQTAASSGELIGRDEVVVAGAATQPTIPSAADSHVCDNATSAIDCLRALTAVRADNQIGYFPGYLPSVLSYLEERYGAVDVQSLLIPTAGAVHYSLKMK